MNTSEEKVERNLLEILEIQRKKKEGLFEKHYENSGNWHTGPTKG